MKKASTVTKNHQPEIPPEADTAIVVDATSSAVMPHPRSEERSVEEVVAQVEKVQRLMKSALIKDEHYGVIPGTNNKPTLLQPGAQKLCFLFRLVPRFHVERVDLPGNHREYTVRCELENSQSGVHVGEGVGLCSTMESKYRWRKAERVCPHCSGDFIKRSKSDDKGWYCYAKLGGCGENFGPKDSRIVGQEVGRKENPDIADAYNTVLKMAKKRAFVDATLTTTAASDIFTQDVEDMDVRSTNDAGHPEPAARPNTRNDRAAGRTAQPTGPSTITGDQRKQLWEYALARAEKTGSTRDQIMRDVLVSLNLKATADIPAEDFERVRGVIEQWEPVMDLATEPEKDSGKAEPGADG